MYIVVGEHDLSLTKVFRHNELMK